MTAPKGQLTALLVRYSKGQRELIDAIVSEVYPELRRLAEAYMKRERPGHTLQPTALVNEAFIRLIDIKSVGWEHRAHFFGAAAGIMRRLLIDHARAKHAEKRGGNQIRIELKDDLLAAPASGAPDLIALDEAMHKLHELNPRLSQIVELRYFAGMSVEETAEVVGVSAPTVKRDWNLAKAWLFRELGEEKKRIG